LKDSDNRLIAVISNGCFLSIEKGPGLRPLYRANEIRFSTSELMHSPLVVDGLSGNWQFMAYLSGCCQVSFASYVRLTTTISLIN
jgi:hypothetical protein